MSFLRSPNSPVTTPTYTGLQLQTSSSAIPIPIVYGINKVAPNILWNGNFQPHYAGKGGGGGGKGGAFSANKGNSAPSSYTTAIVLALCEGPIGGIPAVWDNSTITGFGNVPSMQGQSFISGTIPQTPWSYLTDSFPAQAIAYPGVALVVDEVLSMSSSATLDSYSFEVFGRFAESGFDGNNADPAQVIFDFLTNPQYGVGFPTSSIGSSLFGVNGDSSYQSYCRAAGLAFSPVLTDQEAADSIVTRWLQIINTAAFWSEGLLKFVPYGDTPLTGGLFTGGAIGFSTNTTTQQSTSFVTSPQVQVGTWSFNPDVTPIYNLTDDDFITAGSNEDPLLIKRSDPYTAYNQQYLEISQRSNFYDATPIFAFDQDAIDKYGLRIAPTVTAHEVCDPGIAQTSAQLILQRGLYIRNHYTFKLSWEYGLLEPMDLVTVTDSILGLSNVAVRITSIEEDDQGLLTITAEEFPAGVATAVEYPIAQKNSTGIAANAQASGVNTPIIFEPPFGLAGGLAVWVAVSGQSIPSWGGCNIFASSDDMSYTQIGIVNGPARMGVTTGDLPPVASLFDLGQQTIDSTHVLAVNLSESGGQLNPASATDMLAGNSACFIGGTSGPGEIIAYQSATLTGANEYALAPLQRGAFDSIISDHPAGSPFARLDDQIFKFAYNAAQIGQKVYLKFQSFNPFGGGQQDLADCAAFPYTITGSPLLAPLEPPQNIVVSFGTAAFASLTWDEVSDPRGTVRYKIFVGVSEAVAQQCGDVAHPPFVLPQGPGTYYVKSYIVPVPNLVVESDFSNSIEITGTIIVANNLGSFNQAAENWPGLMVNMVVAGNSPDEQLLLAGACSVDFGMVSDSVGTQGDFGFVSDDVIDVIDLGSLSLQAV